MKKVIIIFLLNFIAGATFAQPNVSKRIRITKEFINCIITGNYSNENIVQKYTVSKLYFKDDSVKKIGEYYINQIRESLNGKFKDKSYPITTIEFFKFSEREQEFQVTGVDNVGEAPASKDLVFVLSSTDSKRAYVNKDDLYVVRFKFKTEYKDEQGAFFILFNEDNKIVSFAGMQIGYTVSLMQF